MVVVPAGRFTMGSPESEPDRQKSEGPQHAVTISRWFAVSRFPVTRVEFAEFVRATGYQAGNQCLVLSVPQDPDAIRKGSIVAAFQKADYQNPGYAQQDNHPVVCLSFDDARAYVEWLNQRAKGYRLMSEAEWEYVTRAGTTTTYWWGSSISPKQANYTIKGEKTVLQGTVPVDSFEPNPWGLYQVHGNVGDWVEDCWNQNYQGAPADGSARRQGGCGAHVVRGGSWAFTPDAVRAASRYSVPASLRISYIGTIRLARTLD
jgi:formylglycine-generating enzyme required for sulfatase activity